jgi:haloalkane dehalogenase
MTIRQDRYSTDQEQYTKHKVEILGQEMAYVDEGEGDPIVFLHGNPTSSYLWRNIIPHLGGLGRCIAPDLVGMGDSAKLECSGPDSYQFTEHRMYLDALLAALNVTENTVLVIHDWGSVLGFDWARRNSSAVQGIAYMEAMVKPLTWDEFPELARPMFQQMRSEDGERMVLQENFFVDQLLPLSVPKGLSDQALNVYRRPFLQPGEDRRPTLTWPRQVPIEGTPDVVVEIVGEYGKWLEEADLPKLFVNAEPGMMLIGAQREYCRTWRNQEEVTVSGMHYIQEDSPNEIGVALREFVEELRA